MSQQQVIDRAWEKVQTYGAYRTIHKIAKRAAKEMGADLIDTEMDVMATHAHIPLRLDELLNADSFNFAHDISGIARHLNRDTGELEGFFVPRYAASEQDTA